MNPITTDKRPKEEGGIRAALGDRGRIARLGFSVVLIVLVGTLGYMLLEHMGFLEALYMTVTTLSTVGFDEVKPLSAVGRVFTILLILGGVSVIAVGLGSMIEFFVGGYLSGLFRRRAVRKQLHEMKGHYVVCGYGRVGRSVVDEFESKGADFVVVELDPETAVRAQEGNHLVVHGDANDDDVLREAGIERARGLVAALGSDADNVFVTLTARGLCPQLIIAARANSDETAAKLRRAGADHVISPYAIGGRKMATLLMQPLVSDYLDVVTGSGQVEFRLEEFALNDTCEVIGRSIQDLQIRSRTGASILAVRHGTGRFDTNPSPDLVLDGNDVVIAIGTPEEMARLEELFACHVRPVRSESFVVE